MALEWNGDWKGNGSCISLCGCCWLRGREGFHPIGEKATSTELETIRTEALHGIELVLAK